MRGLSWKTMGLATKLMGVSAIVILTLMGAVAFWLSQQMRTDLGARLKDRSIVIQRQIEVTRAYITKEYVAKVKQAGQGVLKVAMDHRAPDTVPLPATATREIAETVAKDGLYNARVISRTPLNPANAPGDGFEDEALKALEGGAKESVRTEPVNGVLMFRRVTPDLITSEVCITCHAGAKMGDLVGAVSVQIPMDKAAARVEESIQVLYGAILGVSAAMIGVLFWIIRSQVLIPMARLRAAAEHAQAGDLTARIEVSTADEIGRTSQAFNAMFAKVSDVLCHVTTAARSVSVGASQINAGNQDLSKRTTEQASALVETSSAMEEMTATVKQNADNAEQANRLALAARAVAEGGGQVVTQAVGSMDEISKSSKRIAEIITVIDEIAFQTNLLALNAAVEAARAGEHGRGFAVVAAEVRNLAQRSATAAKEIKGLIQESVQKVRGGSELVTKSGKTLEEIVASVKRVTDIVSEIATASQEQSSGIDQVSKAIVQMDQTTQQNAALVEESASAAESLNQQSSELLALVEFFKVDNAEASPVKREAPCVKDDAISMTREASGSGTNCASRDTLHASEPVGVASGSGHGEKTEAVEEF
jgi:methyl-accepting chemotaxis protein